MDKTAIKNFAIEARKILVKSAITEAGFYGITKDGCSAPIQKGNDFEVYKTLAGTENRIYGDDIKRRANLVKAIEEQGFDQVIEETAYTWFNRIIAIRFMEVNNYLPTRVRVLSSETGSGTPDIITQADTVELNLIADELDKIQTAKRENKYDEAFRLLFVKQCNELNEILPGLFEKTNDYMELLLKITYTGDGVVRMLIDSIPEDNFNVETEGQVEIIGWMYQYYNTELKDDTFAKLKKNVKITKERIPAATQLFTPDWIVRYMVENSLGRVWIEHLRAVDSLVDEKAKAEEFGWKYYLPEAEQEAAVVSQLVEIRNSYKDLKPQDITCIDPCMGSGHILVYMFDVLMDIYRSEGFSEREAVFDILEKNIRGLDIDRRAYQLSYFALMMKARGYNRIFFRGKENLDGDRVIANPQVFAIEESNTVNLSHIDYFCGVNSNSEKEFIKKDLIDFLKSMKDAREYGSAIVIQEWNWDSLRAFVQKVDVGTQYTFETIGIENTQQQILRLLNIGETLSNKYDAVITNPPYMGNAGMNSILSSYCRKVYATSWFDLSTVFMEKSLSLCKKHGFYSMINIPAWMFLSSYEKMRNAILKQATIVNMAHLGRGVFGSDFGTTSFVVRNGLISNYCGAYKRLFDKQVKVTSCQELEDKYFNVQPFIGVQEQYSKIPGRPIAYWVPMHIIDSFSVNKSMGDLAEIVSGMTTGNNDIYLRTWQEVDYTKVALYKKSLDEVSLQDTYWFPYNKGGPYRRWYGNNYYVVNWARHGEFNRAKTTMTHIYLKKCLTWSDITFDIFSARACDYGFFFDVKGSCAFPDEKTYYPLLALMNSTITMMYIKMLNPTVTTQVGDLKRIPFKKELFESTEIIDLAKENVSLVKRDWDSRETSWDFTKHPLLFYGDDLKEGFERWVNDCENSFNRVKANDTKLNYLISEIYNVDDLQNEVADDYVAIEIPTRERAAKSLISYIVGCLFGRYSAEKEGIQYAGGDWDALQHSHLVAKNNILLITDDEYFEDDIVGLTLAWIREVFGEEQFESNINFIAESLNPRTKNAKSAIREYFVTEFYKDHCAEYSVIGAGKRPIYWQFDSGKQNGFKCLVYLHRYVPDLVGIVRSDYFIKTQNAIENALKNAEYIIQTAGSAVDKAQATKKRDINIKQLAELKLYYQALSHIALQRISIDLDDGIKENYLKFQGIEVANEGEKKQTIDLLTKI